MATADDELTTDIIIEGDPEEIDRFRKEYLCVGMVAQLPDDKAHKHGSTSRMGGDHSSALGTDMLSIVLQQLCGHRAQFDGEGHGSREGLAGVISLQECTELNHAAPDEHCFYVSKNMCTQVYCTKERLFSLLGGQMFHTRDCSDMEYGQACQALKRKKEVKSYVGRGNSPYIDKGGDILVL
eukprot:1137879-Pelagomonas_calceolata.AAC.7